MKSIVAELETGEEPNDEAGGDPDGEAEDVDDAIRLVAQQFPDGDQPVVF
jgi:hypothetical protein